MRVIGGEIAEAVSSLVDAVATCADPERRTLYIRLVETWLKLASTVEGRTVTIEEILGLLDTGDASATRH